MSEESNSAQEAAVRARWEGAFVAGPSEKQKFYLTVAYPYPSGAMHVGHGRTYIVPDVIARFWRMRGREVLYPMAFHVTGAPVIGISKRIARRDETAIRLYRDLYRVPQDVLDSFTNPLNIVNHFSNEYERVMKQAGLSIDWTRRFTTVEPTYSKFIEWQWQHLKEAGHVVKGAHPVRYSRSVRTRLVIMTCLRGIRRRFRSSPWFSSDRERPSSLVQPSGLRLSTV